MSTEQALVRPIAATAGPDSDGERTERAVVAAEEGGEAPESHFTPVLGRVAVELDVVVPIREFRIRDLISLDSGNVIKTRWSHGEDLPLSIGKIRLAWTEFEVVDSRLAVRITRLA